MKHHSAITDECSPRFGRPISCKAVTPTREPEADHYHVFAVRGWATFSQQGQSWNEPPGMTLDEAKRFAYDLSNDWGADWEIVWVISCDDHCVGDMISPEGHWPYWSFSHDWKPNGATEDNSPRRYSLGDKVLLPDNPCPSCGSDTGPMVGAIIGLENEVWFPDESERTPGPYYLVGSVSPADIAAYHCIGTNLIFAESELRRV